MESHPETSRTNLELYMVGLYKSGRSTIEIGKMFGISSESVRRILQKLGIRRRSQAEATRKHTIDHYYFMYLNTKDKAFNLGLLLAKGSIYRSEKHGPTIVCHMPTCKKELLLRLSQSVGASRPLYKFKDRDRVSFIVYSTAWANCLERLGWREYNRGDKAVLLNKIAPSLHESIEAGIRAAME